MIALSKDWKGKAGSNGPRYNLQHERRMQMVTTNSQSGTNVHEIADRIYRINTPVVMEGGPGGFSFNQYLIVDDDPLIFHTGPRKMFPACS